MSVEATGVGSKCDNCGATMRWDGAKGQLRCDACGALRTPPPGTGPAAGAGGGGVVDHDLMAALAETKAKGPLAAGARETKCNECGAVVEFPDGVAATKCSFCDSPSVLSQDARTDRLQPESVLPFGTDRNQAVAAFKSWLGGSWFRPGDLMDKASVSALNGVYIPYWTFSAHIDSTWTAERGTHYDEQESYTDANQLTKVRTVQKTRWEGAAGSRSDDVADHLVCASRGLPPKLAHGVASFDTKALVPYAPQFLQGHRAESYALALPEAWQQGQRELEQAQVGRCRSDVGGDDVRSLAVNSRFSSPTFKHTLLPVWIAAFRYNDKVYQFLVNGQNGKVSGEAPTSWAKVLAFVAVLACIIAAIVVALSR